MNYTSAMPGQSLLTQFQGVAYGLPLLSVYFLMGPITLLQGIYAKYFGLSLTTIATVLLIARVFDAVTDPLIGHYADRYYARHGSRKPLIVIGGVLFIVSSWFLYVPFGYDPEEAYSSVSALYLLGWFLVFYLTYTLFEIPHMAWGSELASSSRARNAVFGVRTFCMFFGTLLFFAMPLLPWFENTEFTPETLKWSVLVAGSFMLPLLYICLSRTPGDSESSSLFQLNHHRSCQAGNKREIVTLIFSNKLLLVLTGAHICTGFGAGMYLTLLFIVVDAYLGLGVQFSLMYVISFSVSLASLRLWFVLANLWGKKTAWILGMVLVVIGNLGIGLLSPESTGWLEVLLCMILVSSGYAAFNIMVPSLLSDIIDYGTWKFGVDRTATYFSLYTFVNKSVAAFGGALGLAIAGWVGFDPAMTSHSDTSITGLRLGVAWLPTASIVLSIVFISRIRITTRHHTAIRSRLDRRMACDNGAMVCPLDMKTIISPSINSKHISPNLNT